MCCDSAVAAAAAEEFRGPHSEGVPGGGVEGRQCTRSANVLAC